MGSLMQPIQALLKFGEQIRKEKKDVAFLAATGVSLENYLTCRLALFLGAKLNRDKYSLKIDKTIKHLGSLSKGVRAGRVDLALYKNKAPHAFVEIKYFITTHKHIGTLTKQMMTRSRALKSAGSKAEKRHCYAIVFSALCYEGQDEPKQWFESLRKGLKNEYRYHDQNSVPKKLIFQKTPITVDHKEMKVSFWYSGPLKLKSCQNKSSL